MIAATMHAVRAAGEAFARSFSLYRRGEWRVHEDDDGLDFGEDTASGVAVTRTSAYRCSYWYRGINLIASTVAKTPIDVLDITDQRRQIDKAHASYRLLGGCHKPNPHTLNFHFKQALTAQALGHGGGFAYIFRDAFGRPEELLQLRADRTYLVKEDKQYLYVTSLGGDYGETGSRQYKLLPENVLHIHGLGWDGLTGYSVMDLAADAIGGSMAKERYGSVFFRNSASPSVIVKTPKTLSDKAFEHLRKSWSELRTGLSNAHKPVILEDGADATPFSVSARDAQLIEAMEHDPILIANFLGLPGYKLGVKGTSSYASLEIESQSVLDDAIDPWLVPWEQELDDKLLTEDEKSGETRAHKFRRKELIRVDIAKRYAAHRTALGGHPFRSINEVRLDENEDPVEGYDYIPKPLNMTTGKGGDKDGQEDDENPDSEPMRQLWLQTCRRMCGRLHTALGRGVKRRVVSEASVRDEHSEVLREAFGPLIRLSRANTTADAIATELVRSAVAASASDQLDTWASTTPERIVSQVLREKTRS